MTHNYKRNGTATLFAAMDAFDGTLISMCDERHRHQEWLKFLRVIDQTSSPKPIAARRVSRCEELIMAIGEFIDKRNQNPKPFIWTAKAFDILENVKRARRTLDNRHPA